CSVTLFNTISLSSHCLPCTSIKKMGLEAPILHHQNHVAHLPFGETFLGIDWQSMFSDWHFKNHLPPPFLKTRGHVILSRHKQPTVPITPLPLFIVSVFLPNALENRLIDGHFHLSQLLSQRAFDNEHPPLLTNLTYPFGSWCMLF